MLIEPNDPAVADDAKKWTDDQTSFWGYVPNYAEHSRRGAVITMHSKPSRRRTPFGTVSRSNVAVRALGTANSMPPASVEMVFG